MRERSGIMRLSRSVSSCSLEKTEAKWERRKRVVPYQVKKWTFAWNLEEISQECECEWEQIGAIYTAWKRILYDKFSPMLSFI
jgi:hypothetical protein